MNPITLMRAHFVVSLSVLFFNAAAFAFYNPAAGRWLNRDPLAEAAGKNLYAVAGNNLPNGHDVLGLLEITFEKNSRSAWGILKKTSGEWSQPDGFGEGEYVENSNPRESISSWIHLWSGPVNGGVCNSIDGTLPLPPLPNGVENKDKSAHAGAFRVLARHTCRQKFRLEFSVSLIVKAKGPGGDALARLWQYGGNETVVSIKNGEETKIREFQISMDVVLDKRPIAVIQYTPAISFLTSPNTVLRESEGVAFGLVEVVGFSELVKF